MQLLITSSVHLLLFVGALIASVVSVVLLMRGVVILATRPQGIHPVRRHRKIGRTVVLGIAAAALSVALWLATAQTSQG